MKISELRHVLKGKLVLHGDIEVETTWEGITQKIYLTNIYLGKRTHYEFSDNYNNKILFIDADRNSYKKKYAVDPREGEMKLP